MQKNVLEVYSISKAYGQRKIINNISFKILEGEILGFIGVNGAGKTTVIKLILGLQSIDSGKVLINGYNIKNQFTAAIKSVGAIVENPDMYMYLSGYNNLKLIASMYKDIKKQRIDEVVKLVGLENRIHDKVNRYSLGMRERLGIAAALLNKPKLLILDEPTNGLDPEGIKDLRNLLKKLANDEKVGILISSHNLSELDNFCNTVCIINNGKILKKSNITDIKSTEKPIYQITVDNVENIDTIITEKIEIIDNNNIKLHIEKDYIPTIMKTLIKNNKKIYEVKMLEMSLEEAFFKRVGGDN